MSTRKAIRILLDTGSVTGLRHAELVNWTGQAIACPRVQIKSLSGWPESKRPGVYFLYGDDPNTAAVSVYIGEAENVFERLKSQLMEKDFWNEVILFTNKDDNLTKAHVKYLESKLVQVAISAGRYPLLNGTQPQPPTLPRGDLAAMDEFVEHVRTLLGVLGHKTLEPVTLPESGTQVGIPAIAQTSNPNQPIFFLSGKGIEARAVQSNEGLVVLEGAGFFQDETASLSDGNKRLRAQLQDNGVVGLVQSTLQFLKSHIFSTPSQAASVILAVQTNGQQAWKTDAGKSIADFEKLDGDSI